MQPRRDQKEEEEKERYGRVQDHFNEVVIHAVELINCKDHAFPIYLGKLPKNCDPKATPDPERWLPMRERSYYRGKKKGKKKEQIGKGTQGATAGASAEL